MRKLSYRLSSGKEVNTLKEAVNSGENFKSVVRPIPKEEPNMHPIRKGARPIAR